MDRKRKPAQACAEDTEFGDDYTSLDVASLTEVTGSVPRPPANEAEAENYSDIVSMPQQCADHAGRQKLRKSKRQG